MPEPDPFSSIKTPWDPGSAPSSSAPGAAGSPPVVVPDHTLLRHIGKGSYGEVWLAKNILGTYRAVKVVHRKAFEHDRPFQREFAGIQRFEPVSRSHESQLNVLQVGRGPDCFYYVMELADDMSGAHASGGISAVGGTSSASPHPTSSIGGTNYTSPQLSTDPESGTDTESGTRVTRPSESPPSESRPAERQDQLLNPDTYTPRTLRSELFLRGRLPVDECIRLGLALTTALEHLHRHGLVHRDIKPSNIIFVNGIPKLADIGLVARAEATMSFVGTEGYLPPEGPGTTQADLFSLGRVLYEISTGHDRQQFPELPTNVQELPDRADLAEFNEVLIRACAPDVKQRYQTAAEMHADLALLQSGRSVVRLRGIERKLRFLQRAGAVVTVLAAVIALGWWWQARETNMVRQLVQEKEQQRKLAQDNLYFADIRVAYNEWESGQIAKTLELLRRHIPQGAEPDRRGWEWYYLLSLCHRDERTLQAHSGFVQEACCDPTGRRFASGGEDHVVRIWDAESGACLAELKGHNQTVLRVRWSPDGTRLASGDEGGKLILWDATTFHRLFVLDCDQDVQALAWSPDGKQIAAGGIGNLPPGRDGLVTIWDASSGQRLHYLTGNFGMIWSLAWHPAGKLLAAGGDYHGQMYIWDADNGQRLRTIQAHSHAVDALAWSPDGRELASASSDQCVKIWDAETWEPVTTIDPAHNGSAITVLWSEDGRRLVSGGADGLIKIWDARTGQQLNALRGHQGHVTSIAWWPGHGRLLSGSDDGTLKIWNPDSEQVARTVAGEGVCAWSPDGRQLAVGSPRGDTNGGVIQILDVATWRTLFTLPVVTNQHPWSLAWTPGSRRLAAGYGSGQVQVWELATRQEILFLPKAHGGQVVRSVAWSPDGRLLATAGNDGSVRLWNVETKENVLSFFGHSNSLNCAVWSPDGRWIASKDSRGEVLVWSAATGQVKLKVQCHTDNPGNQHDLSWSPQGDKLAAGGRDGTVMVWDAKTGRVLHILKGHTSTVRSIQWSPDGRRLVSGAEDRTIRIWDSQSGRELLMLPDPQNIAPTVVWSPDGRMIGVGGNRSAVVYDATLGYKLAPQLAQSPTNR